MSNDQVIINHYKDSGIGQKILTALNEAGKDLTQLTPADLSPVDEFHIGGRVATAHLMTYLQWHAEMHILDVGSGLGGAARYVAENTRARLTGIDITTDYCTAAAMLTQKTKLEQFIIYRQGSATNMPFADEEFDGAYSIHTAMNIEDKVTLYREISRTLKSGGYFGLYDVLRGTNETPLSYPVPWAKDENGSFLASIETMRRLLGDAGFEILVEDDMSGFGLLALKKLQAINPALGPKVFMGGNYDEKIANLIRNIETKRCAPWVMVCRKRKRWENETR